MTKCFKISIGVLLLAIGVTASASDFCAGYEDGYSEGYCDGKFSCLKPLPPLCPLPNLGESTYRDGYNRGFKEGLRKSQDSTY